MQKGTRLLMVLWATCFQHFPTIVSNHKHQRGTPSFIHVVYPCRLSMSFIHVYPMIPPWSIQVNPPHQGTIEDAVHNVHPILRNSQCSGFTISCSERLATSSTLYFTSRTCRNEKKTPGDWKILRFLDSLFACCPENIFRP